MRHFLRIINLKRISSPADTHDSKYITENSHFHPPYILKISSIRKIEWNIFKQSYKFPKFRQKKQNNKIKTINTLFIIQLYTLYKISSKPIPYPLIRHFSQTVHLAENFHSLPHLPAEKHDPTIESGTPRASLYIIEFPSCI